MLDSGVSSSNSVPPGRSQFTGWNTTPNSAKTRRAAFIRRPVRGDTCMEMRIGKKGRERISIIHLYNYILFY